MLPHDPEERARELYAQFGLAYYLANVFETGLSQAIMLAEFLVQKRPEILSAGMTGFDRVAYEEEFDRFMDQLEKLTAGALMQRLNTALKLQPALHAKVRTAIERRNFLAHHFFRKRIEQFYTSSGQEELLAELEADQELFRLTDRELFAALRPLRESVGMTDELVEKHVAQELKKMRDWE